MFARLGFAIGMIGLAWSGAQVSAQPAEALCARLSVPAGLQLDCVIQSDAAGTGIAAVVRPTDSEFGPLSELRLHQVEEAVDDPAAWLREQLTLDLTPLDAAIDELIQGPDSPITGTPLADQLQSWRGLLGSAATLPLTGCRDPVRLARDETWEMACEWEVGPLRQFMRFRLIEKGSERYAIRIRTMNEQRLRHLVAITNSF
jgi:hypothetical protein